MTAIRGDLRPESTPLRLGIVGIVVVSLFAALFARLWYLQVMTAEEYAEVSQANRIRVITEEPPRGRIFDVEGRLLVDNRTSLVVTLDPRTLDDLEERERDGVVRDLARELTAFGVPTKVDRIERRLVDPQFNPLQPVPVAVDVPEALEVFLAERAAAFPGVEVSRESVRTYPHDALAAHVIGYVGRISAEEWEAAMEGVDDHPKPYEPDSNIGKSGIERQYEDVLRGTPGRRVIEVDVENRPIRTIEYRAPRPGHDLQLALDIDLQARTEAELAAQLEARTEERVAAPAGAVVILDPTSGAVRAMASYPTYDPTDFVNGISTERYERLVGGDPTENPLTNRALTGLYAPGSTFKPITAYAGLDTGLITPDSPYHDTGSYRIENCTAQCLRFNAGSQRFGTITLHDALTVSSNTYFFRIGEQLWAREGEAGHGIQVAAERFGLGSPTGIDLPGEQGGLVPYPDVKEQLHELDPVAFAEPEPWYPGDAVNLSVGQGLVNATPLQMATAYGAIANGGTVWRPQVAAAVRAPGGREGDLGDVVIRTAPDAISTLEFAPGWLEAMHRGLEGVTRDEGRRGTAAAAFQGWDHERWPVAAKTGTAEVGGREDSSVFGAYGPTHDPRYVAFALLEESGFGGEAAAPMVRRIYAPLAGLDEPDGGEDGDDDHPGDRADGEAGGSAPDDATGPEPAPGDGPLVGGPASVHPSVTAGGTRPPGGR